MHEIDRTTLEFQPEGPFSQEYEGYEFGETGELNEQETNELAAELLEVTNEQELDHFLGDLIKGAGKALSGFANSSVGKVLVPMLKGAAKKGLSLAGSALGGAVGGPLGAKIGSGLADAAGNILGLEVGEMAGEDREFAGARQFVKLANDAVKQAASAPPGSDPRAVAHAAAVAAAQAHAPGLLSGNDGAPPAPAGRGGRGGPARSGRWFRHGNKIVVICA